MTEKTKNLERPIGLPPSFAGQDSFFEKKKNAFLGAIYENNGSEAESLYGQILKKARQKTGLTETEEKYLRQIQVAFKRFNPFLRVHASPKIADRYRELQSIIRKNVREQSTQPIGVAYNTWQDKMDLAPWQQELIFTHAITFQMTSGCSNFCRRCNEWALPKIRSHFSKDAVNTILKELLHCKNLDLALYGASDPLDWEDFPHDLRSILSGLDPLPKFSILTKLPRGKEPLLNALLKIELPLSVSLTDRNKLRIEALEAQINRPITKQHASKDLLIPAGLDEDFISVKPSITDAYGTEITPEGACIIIPTFTSGLHPFGHKKLPITRETTFFPVKKIGRQALLVDYFKPLEVMGREKRIFHLPTLLDVQVESILLDNGSDELTPPGMRSLREYFSIFDDKPRQQRKQMTRSVMGRLKKQYLIPGGYRAMTETRKKDYREKIAAHLDFCKPSVVAESRCCALSFFLETVTRFIELQPVKSRIIAFFLREEALGLQEKYTSPGDTKNIISLLGSGANAWEIFRFFATALLAGRHKNDISEFITACPAKYDPIADRFIPCDLKKI
jgi:hypothetical protein